MTLRQRVLKLFYPVLMKGNLFASSKVIRANKNYIKPYESFYSLNATAVNGSAFDFLQLKGKKVLIVNTASDCGYTAQYAELQKLFEKYSGKLTIIAFPSNDFKEQETLNDEAINTFCRINYGVTFPIMSKSSVVKSKDQNEVFLWLTTKAKNGWNEQEPVWNFSKYLVNEFGILTHFFEPSVSPLSKAVISAINQ